MSTNSIYELYQTMERNHAMISFKGVVTADILGSVLKIIELKLEHIEKSAKTRKKVYSVLVECLQNLYHHNEFEMKATGDMDSITNNTSVLCISNPDDYYEIKTGNFVNIKKADELKKKIEDINKLDKNGLRDMYKMVLNEGQFSNKGTAGLGLIDIAKKSGNKLEFSFIPYDENFSFFCLNVKIN